MTHPLISSLDNPFWQFSLKVYQDEKVKETCLSFQSREDVNVNLLLLCCWLSYAVETVSENEFKEACNLIVDWHQHITQAIRKIRQHLKTLASKDWIRDFYQQILAEELTSESYQQYTLYQHFAEKQKKLSSKNEELMLYYLFRLFDEMKLVVDKELELRIRQFATLIHSKIP